MLFALALTAVLQATPGEAGDAPQLAMDEAIARGKAYAKEKKLDLSKQYLEAAEFDRQGATPKGTGRCWKLRWQVPRAKGGTTFITVCEDGRTEATFGE